MKTNSQDRLIGLSEAEQILADRRAGRSKLYEMKDGKIVVDHVKTANAMAMFIANVPMDKIIKKILLMRIGSPLIRKAPMSHMAIALKLGMLESEVKEVERIGLERCNEFMLRSSGRMFSGTDNKGLILDTMNEVVDVKNPGEGSK